MAQTDPLAGLQVPNTGNDLMKNLSVNSGYGGMDTALQGLGKLPGLTETILPSIQKLLSPGPDNAILQGIDRSTQSNVAAAQTESMKRGLTGSDIEMGAMSAERATGEQAKGTFLAQNAQQLASFMKDLATGDIQSQRENLIMMAQAMGQKITSDQDLLMFREMLAANIDQAGKNRDSAMIGAGIGAISSIAGGAMARGR
jgi:hypothetical protein